MINIKKAFSILGMLSLLLVVFGAKISTTYAINGSGNQTNLSQVDCAYIVNTTSDQKISAENGKTYTLSFNLTNCSRNPETLHVDFTDLTQVNSPDCRTASFSTDPVILKPGETRGFSIEKQAPLCAGAHVLSGDLFTNDGTMMGSAWFAYTILH